MFEVRAVITTSNQQKRVAATASSVKPKTSPHAPPSAAVPRRTSGSRAERGTRCEATGSWCGAFVATLSASGATSAPRTSPTRFAARSILPDSATAYGLLPNAEMRGHPFFG